eukprot:SAG11_NODE_14410_length_613_cov_0.780156_1_plen_31_part_10
MPSSAAPVAVDAASLFASIGLAPPKDKSFDS